MNKATATLNATDPGCFSSPQTGSCVRTTVYQIDGGSVTTYTGPFSESAAGTHSLTYHSTDYAGNVEGTETTNFGITATTTTSLSSSANPSGLGKSVTFTVIVTPGASGTPTGKVTFKDGATVLSTTSLNSAGKATFATTKLAAGSHSITASFLGSTYFLASGPAALTQVVEKDSTTTLASSANPSQWGHSITLTATVSGSGGTPTGTVTFKNGATILGAVALSSGKATFVTSTLTVGTHSITAVYSGDSKFVGSTSAVLKQVVNKAGTTSKVASSMNPSNSGQTVTFTATVKSATTGTPTGTVKFMDGVTLLGSKTLAGGTAAFSTSKLAKGTHSITAVYGGSVDFNTSTLPALLQKVN